MTTWSMDHINVQAQDTRYKIQDTLYIIYFDSLHIISLALPKANQTLYIDIIDREYLLEIGSRN